MKTRLTILLLLISIVGMGQGGKYASDAELYFNRQIVKMLTESKERDNECKRKELDDISKDIDLSLMRGNFIDKTEALRMIDKKNLIIVSNDTIPTLRTWDKYLEWCNDSVMQKEYIINVDAINLNYILCKTTNSESWTGKYIKTINEPQPNYKGFIEWIRRK